MPLDPAPRCPPLPPLRKGGRGFAPWEKWAVAAWVLVIGVAALRALAWPRTHSVYPIFAQAARNWQEGQPLYAQAAPTAGAWDVFRYSPLVAAALTPLSWLPDPAGGVLWRLINAGALLGGIFWFSRAVLLVFAGNRRGLLFLLVLPLAAGNLNNGQSNPLVLGLVLGAVAAAAERRWNLSAGCLALGCLFKIYPLAVGLLLVVVYPRRLGLRLA